MGRPIDKIMLRGFKSIEALVDFTLYNLNILIGANGAGKSNFVDYFRMLRAMADEAFQQYVLGAGGGDGFLFLGPKTTREIFSRIEFGPNSYEHVLHPTAGGSLLITSETMGYNNSTNTYSARQKSILKSIKDQTSYMSSRH